jgi:hypothetical protein
MYANTEIDLLIEVIVKREKAKGYTDTDARVFALGYLASFVQKHFIDNAPKAKQKLLRADVLERIAIVAGDL